MIIIILFLKNESTFLRFLWVQFENINSNNKTSKNKNSNNLIKKNECVKHQDQERKMRMKKGEDVGGGGRECWLGGGLL